MMKIVSTLTVTISFLIFSSCKTHGNITITPEETEAKQELFKDVVRIEIWKIVDGMNSSPVIIEDKKRITKICGFIGGVVDENSESSFNAGITFINDNGTMIIAELNISDESQTINYFNQDGEMEYHGIFPRGVRKLKKQLKNIDSPKN